jgi:tRNA pseudouridine55 synthase
MDGFVVVDKPAGITSHDVVALVRRAAGMKKAGHTGTLDPFATGVLPVALGEGTKAIPYLDEDVKEYLAIMKLGQATDTGDLTGEVIRTCAWQGLDVAAVTNAAARFVGVLSQTPPMYSALKRNGVPLYKLARRGETVEREPRQVTIYSIAVSRVELPEVEFTVRCSRGTYVRTLAEDLGEHLGCCGHLVQLRRLKSGLFGIGQAIPAAALRLPGAQAWLDEALLSPLLALGHLREFSLTREDAARVAHGIVPLPSDLVGWDRAVCAPGERVRLSSGDRLAAVAEICCNQSSAEGRVLRLLRVFN